MTTAPSRANVLRTVRLVSLLLSLTVFFLPLHFHPIAASAHMSKECSCIHGSRTEMGMAPAQVDWTPPRRPLIHESFQPQLSSSLVISFQLIRAPPSL